MISSGLNTSRLTCRGSRMRSISITGRRCSPKRFCARRKIPVRIVSCLLRVRAEVDTDLRHAAIIGAVTSSSVSDASTGARRPGSRRGEGRAPAIPDR